jgi:vesicle-associated membrane protein 7
LRQQHPRAPSNTTRTLIAAVENTPVIIAEGNNNPPF